MNKTLLLLVTLLGSVPASSQTLTGESASRIHPNAVEVRINERTQSPLFVQFDRNSFLSASAGMEAIGPMLGTGVNDAWRSIRSETDELGMRHLKYQQLYRNIPVVTGEYILHESKGRITSANGVFYKGLNIPVNAGVSEKQALDAATRSTGATKFLWESSVKEQEILHGHGHDNAYPKGELVILPSLPGMKERGYRLAWKFDVYALDPHMRWNIYVDAQNAEVLFKEERICNVTVNGTAVTKYSGVRTLQTDSTGAGQYRLRDYSRGGGIETYDMNTGTTYANAVDFTDSDNYWNTTTNQDDAAYDAHWGTQMTYDYYMGTHSRNSYNNTGGVLKSYVHYNLNYNNAFWNGSVMTYGDGNGSTFSPLTEIDIIAHEITHGVTEYSSDLIYSYESGALNESFSDIFGVTIDFFARPATANFLIGDQSYTPATSGDALRYMNNPNQAGDPDTYLGNYWESTSYDNGGVHINSGVQNFWYYLLCQGGSGTNDNGFAYNVTGIGMTKARMIAYRNNNVYLTSGSQFADAAFYALKSANDLYGTCSPEAIAVKNAWDAVGVYGLQLNANATASVSGASCEGGSIQLSASGGTTYSWTGPGGFTSSLQNPVISNATSANSGQYICAVTDANGCSGSPMVNVTLSAQPTLSVTSSGSSCSGGSVQLNAVAAIPGSGQNTGVNTTPVNVPDNNPNGVFSSITINGSTNAANIVSVTIDSLTHTWNADLKIELMAPNGSVIVLANGVGGSGDNFIRTRFVTGATAISSGTSPFTGNYAPAQAFSNLSGSANGTWKLYVKDLYGADIGTLWKWSINLPANTIASYSWTPPSGLSSTTISNPTAVPTSTTTYTVTVSSSQGCSATGSVTVASGVVYASIASTTVSCFGAGDGSASIQATGNSLTYLWSNGETTATISNLAPGTYTCTVTDSAGCWSSYSTNVTGPTQLVANTTVTDAACGLNNGSAQLTVSGGTTPYAYLWSNGSTGSSITALPAGVYAYTVTDAKGCSMNGTATVSQGAGGAPSAPASITGDQYAVCGIKTYSCATVQGASTYNWTVPTGAIISSGQGTTTVSVSFPAGFVTGTLSVNASNACGTSSAITLSLFGIPATPGTITGPNTAVCGATVSYSIPASITGATTYNWTVSAGAVIMSGQGTTTVSVKWPSTSITNGSVCVTASNSCGASASRCMTSIRTAPLKPASIAGPLTVCRNQTNLSYSVTSQPGATFTWTMPSGVTILSGQGTSSILVRWGTRSGTMKVVASNACGSTQATSLKVTVNCREDNTPLTGISLVPNPSNGDAVLQFDRDSQGALIMVHDMLGRQLLSERTNDTLYRINLRNRPKGVYLITVKFSDGETETLRMVISE
jgi:Zn-dependent metalloprotease/subtilisin-like proprotein convertase family protein